MSAVQVPREERAQLGGDVERLLRAALEEDLGPGQTGAGDVTSEPLFPTGVRARGRLIAKGAGVVAGLAVFVRVFELLEGALRARTLVEDGAPVKPGDVVAELEGSALALLAGERTALNLVQRLSGIASLTARFVAASGGRARILDTRKTTPGLRRLEKAAVRAGGGENHRSGLFDQAMLKNNHVDLLGRDPGELVAELRARHGAGLTITAEARDEREALAAIRGGADVVLLDNLAPGELRALCPRLRAAAGKRARPLELEASGGVTLENVAEFAAAGVDRVSIGALTHSAPALDFSLRLEPLR